MAIYHFTAKVVSRGKGQSAVAKAAYNAREKLEDKRLGETHDYRRKGGIVFEGIFAPKDAPEWVRDRGTLYNEIERCEKRKDAQLVREVEIALPHELTAEQRERLVKDFVREQFVRKGMVADVCIHEPDKDGDQRNHHAHILLSMRSIGADGFGAKVREWNSREQLETWREGWERTANRYLEKHGHEARIDRRTLEEQGVEREPTTHRGPHIDAMEKDGVATERGNEWRDAGQRKAMLDELVAELAAVENEIRAMETEAYLDAADRERQAWDDKLHDAAVEKEKGNEKAGPQFDESEHATDEENRERRRETGLEAAVFATERAVEIGFDIAAKGVEVTLEAAATSIESLFDFGPARTTRTSKQPEQKPDLRRYLSDVGYRQRMIQQEIAERHRREREYYERQRDRER